MSTAQKNGAVVTPKSNDTKTVANPSTELVKKVIGTDKPAQVQPTPEVQTSPAPEPPKLPSLEEQREKSRKLNLLFEKEHKLTETKRNLDSFKISRDETSSSLILSDGKTAKFTTYSPTLIKKVLELIQLECEAMLSDTSKEIVTLG